MYKVLTKNITKKLQHISVCSSFNSRCTGDGVDAMSMVGFRNRAIMACDGYKGNSSALESESDLKSPRPYVIGFSFFSLFGMSSKISSCWKLRLLIQRRPRVVTERHISFMGFNPKVLRRLQCLRHQQERGHRKAYNFDDSSIRPSSRFCWKCAL